MTGPVLHVDLDRFAHNLAVARERIAPAQLMLVVKDDAYGHGLDAIVRRAEAEGIGWYGAFDLVTGLRVRDRVGAGPRIFTWLPPTATDIPEAIEADLDIGVGDLPTLDALARAADDRGGGPASARVHLEVDSGLHRGGVRLEEWDDLVDAAVHHEDAGSIQVEGVFSHLAEASDADDDAARDVFERAVASARASGLRPAFVHLAASAASFARPEFRYDLCRVGAFCYGIRPAGGPGEAGLGVAPVATLEAEVTGVSDVAVTLQVGATHGIPSLLGRRAVIGTPDGHRRVDRIGDHDTLVSPWPSAAVGDRVAIWGADAAQSATDLGELIGTIGEEIAVRTSPRVRRGYG